MIVSILCIIACFLSIAFVLFLTIRNKNYKELALHVALDILLVFFGFSLAMLWDHIKEVKVERTEKESLVRLLQTELTTIYMTIDNDLDIINLNLKALANDRQITRPLLSLETNVWESARLRNTVFAKDSGDFLKLVSFYSVVHIVNEQIRFREQYRATNQAISNYKEVLASLDGDIKQALEKVKPLYFSVQKYLYRDFSIFKKGDCFSFDKGFVRKENDNKIPEKKK